MAHNDTDAAQPGTALIALEPPRARIAPRIRARVVPTPTFVSQLLAARGHLPAQREMRRAGAEEATAAYDEGRRRGVRRLPMGSYQTRVV